MDMTLRPGDFPLGSMESRAAVRAMIEREQKSKPRFTIVVKLAGHPPRDCKGKWCRSPEGEPPTCTLTREENKYHVTEDRKVEEVIVLKAS